MKLGVEIRVWKIFLVVSFIFNVYVINLGVFENTEWVR